MSEPYRLVIAGRARTAILRIGAWWKEHRIASPNAFADELTHVLELLAQAPASGRQWPSAKVRGVRRWLLPTTRHHVYYTVDETRRTVIIRMIWYAGRERGPTL